MDMEIAGGVLTVMVMKMEIILWDENGIFHACKIRYDIEWKMDTLNLLIMPRP